MLSVPRQRADYSTVIGWAAEQPYIDSRVSLAPSPILSLASPEFAANASRVPGRRIQDAFEQVDVVVHTQLVLVILMLAPTVTVVGSEVRVAETPSP